MIRIHTPVVTMLDEPGTPRMTLVARCIECDVVVTRRPIDVNLISDTEIDDIVTEIGSADAHEFLKHIREAQP